MINLLPYDKKHQVKAARHNVILIKCLIFLLFALIFMILACWVTNTFIRGNTNAKVSSSVSGNESSSILSQAETIKSDILTANNAITQRVDYSAIITSLAAAMPAGVIIDTLSADGATSSTPIQLILHASADSKGKEFKTNLEKSNLFTNVTIKSVTPAQVALTGYPYDISLTLMINKANNI